MNRSPAPRVVLVLALALLLSLPLRATSDSSDPSHGTARDTPRDVIAGETRWSGVVTLTRTVEIVPAGRLVIEPGTEVRILLPETTGSEPPPAIVVRGRIRVEGTAAAPVRFLGPGRNPQSEDMIYVFQAAEAEFRHALFEGGGWALHVHETPARIFGCVFRKNYGGLRFMSDGLAVEGSRFEGNTVGLRCLRSSGLTVAGNAFTGNLTGIFFREGVTGARMERNLFDDVEYDIKLGESQSEDVVAPGNYWKAAAGGRLPAMIYDGEDSEGVGRVRTEPRLADPPGELSR